MSERGGLVERLAEAVADGVSVDWAAVHARCAPGREARVAANLRWLDQLASRTHPATPLRHAHERAGTQPPLWLRGLRVLAALQSASGLAGFVFGVPDSRAIPPGLPLLGGLTCGLGAAVLLHFGRRDPRAGHLGTFFLLLAAACSHRGAAWLDALLPAWSSVFGWLHAPAVESFVPFFLWSFVHSFPRVVALRRLDVHLTAVRRACAAGGAALLLAHVGAYALDPAAPETIALLGPFTHWHSRGFFWGLVLALSAPAPAVALRRARDAAPGERRRVTWFLLGLGFGFAPLCLLVLLEVLVPPFARLLDAAPELERWGALLVFGGVLSMPLTCAYAVLAHRVLDLHGTAAGSLARRALLGGAGLVLPALTAGFGLSRLYALRGQSLDDIARGADAPFLAAAFGATLLLLYWRNLPRRAVRRLLGSEPPDWRRVVAGFGHALRAARTRQAVYAELAATTARALQIERVLVLERGEQGFVPAGGEVRPLGFDSAVATLCRPHDDEPLVTDPDAAGSLFPWLPESDRSWLADADARALMPLSAAGELVGLLVVGARIDGRALDHDDLLLLGALGGAAAPVLEASSREPHSPTEGGTAHQPALECAACERVTPADAPACACGGGPRQPAALPSVLAGKFRLEAVLGRGGMGVVYRALDLELGRLVALKTLPRLHAEAALRLRDEARTMATLIHPHLASIYGAESWCGLPVLVVEHLAGGTLASRPKPLALPEVLRMGRALADALDAMHNHGLLHRDVKPGNIGFTVGGVPKLLDFGLVRLIEALGEPPAAVAEHADAADIEDAATRSRLTFGTTGTAWAGTLLYMPPEALRGAAVGVAQDVWGLALSLYEALAGRHPLAGLPAADLGESLGRLPDLRTLWPDCPPAVEAFFRRALHASPAQRPSSMTAFAEELAALAQRAA